MIWARKMIDLAEWQAIQDQFEELFVKVGCPGQMMLVATSDPDTGQTDLIMSLANSGLLSLFQGFERISESDLPAETSLLVGHNNQFEKRFKYPARNSRI